MIALAVVAGVGLGFVLQRGDFCFHSTWRRLLTEPRDGALLRAYLTMLVVSTPIVQLLISLDVVDPFIPPLAWRAVIPGGLVFGIGMVVASTCISGMFYKLGSGMLGMVVALGAWAVGDLITYRGPLSGLRERLNEDPVTVSVDGVPGQVATVDSAFGPAGIVALVLAAVVIGGVLVRGHLQDSGLTARGDRWGWLTLGLATAAVMALGWLLVGAYGFVYSYGTSGVPNQLWERIVAGNSQELWIPIGLLSVVPGALIAALVSGTLWVRGESARRYAQLAAGGLLMGIGAAVSGGCNLGHSMVGVPLLSLGSIIATVAIIAGVAIGHGLVTRLPTASDVLVAESEAAA